MSNFKTEYNAALGREGLSAINKFGFQAAIGTASIAVWDRAIAYNYIAAATVLKVSSSSTADDAGSTGATTVTLSGLDANYDAVSETVTMDGQTTVTTTQTFLRIFRMVVDTAGSGGVNAGTIFAYTGAQASGTPSTATLIYAQITIGANQTLMAVYTVPANCTALMTDLTVSGDASQTITAELVARPLGGVFNIKEKFLLNNGVTHIQHVVPKSFAAKTDLELRAKVSASTTDIAAMFDALCIPNVA